MAVWYNAMDNWLVWPVGIVFRKTGVTLNKYKLNFLKLNILINKIHLMSLFIQKDKYVYIYILYIYIYRLCLFLSYFSINAGF